jgi:hypothetical protein
MLDGTTTSLSELLAWLLLLVAEFGVKSRDGVKWRNNVS